MVFEPAMGQATEWGTSGLELRTAPDLDLQDSDLSPSTFDLETGQIYL